MSLYTLTPVDFNPFEEGIEIDKIVSTNEPQKEIWLSCAVGGEQSSLAYNESVSLDLQGDFHSSHFLEALHTIVSRHEALRSSVSPNGESLFIYKNIPFDIPLIDISTATAQQELLTAFTQAQMHSLFDLEEGPLFRMFLHKLSNHHYYFTLVVHHIVGDGWSLGVILEDLSKLYNASLNREDLALEEATQISQYAAEMADFEQSIAYRRVQDYWLDMYKESVPVLDLPTDFPRPATRTYKAERLDYQLTPELVEKLKKTGAKVGCSLVNTLLSAFEVFLYLQTNQRDIVVGLPTAGQAATGHFDLVGHCVNLLPLRSSIDPALPFNAFLKLRKAAFFDAYEHQQFTFGQLIKKLNIQRDHSRIPLVPVIFNIDMGMGEHVHFDQLTHTLISNPRAYETFEIFLNATSSKSAFTLEWSYNTQLFSRETITKMASGFEELLQAIATDASVAIKDLSLKNTASWSAQLKLWNNTAQAFPKGKPFTTLVDQFAIQSPTKTALKFKDKSFTYQQLFELSNKFSHWLIAGGIKKGDIVGLLVDRSAEMVVALLGILKAGATYIPLDPEYPEERITYMLADSDARMLVLSKIYSGKFDTTAKECIVENIWAELGTLPKDLPTISIQGSDLAYVLYTSGSTGKPKGVKIKHDNLVNFLVSMQAVPGINATDRLLAITTISFDIAGLELYLPLIAGAELVVCPQDAARDGRLLLELIEDQNITIMQATPATWRMMIDSGWSKHYQLKVLCGGEALAKDLADKLLAQCDSLWNVYGPTETTIWSTLKQVSKHDEVLSIGHPIANTQIYILNEDNQLVAPGTIGEICIGGEGVAAGYLNHPALTNERFINDNFSPVPGQKLYKTGDLGKFLDNGEIVCLGRIDQQVKIRGYRIELGEIENQLTAQDDIKQAVVIAREDIPGNKNLVAYVTLAENEIKDISPSWKDRWDTLYDIAAEGVSGQELSSQNIDVNLLENWNDNDKLAEEAEEWLQQSVQRIRKLQPQHVLEIGSGGGQLLFEIAPYTQSYIATDYAQTAIDKLQHQLNAAPEKWSHVSAKACPADDFSGIPARPLDMIIIHSVAQYFPNTAYFIKVIEESVKRLRDGGCLFIGDMQGKNSLEMCHAMDQLAHAKPNSSHAEFEEVVQNRVKIEDEFIADPQFFYLLPKLIPAITGIDVQLRQGQSQNETTKYHFDIWLYVNSDHQFAEPLISLDWEQLGTMDALLRKLQGNLLETIEIKNIFNARTAKDHTLLNWLKSAQPAAALQEIKASVEHLQQGLHPDLFWQLGKDLGFEAHVRWTTDGTDGKFDVVFIPEGVNMFLPGGNLATVNKGSKPADFARTPLSTNEVFISKSTLELWKNELRLSLPDYMVPTDFVALKEFPLTPNYKIDKKALPKPQPKSNLISSTAQLPHNKNEQLISDIWSAVLGLENISIKDDFFELGGHSLLAVKVMSSIEKETGKRLPLALLFENATIEKLAVKLESDEEEEWDVLVPIKTTGTKPPLYLIHGGGLNILFYKPIIKHLSPDQPVYGLQAIGLSKEATLLYHIEEIAAVYVADMLKLNPEGPYYLAGYSFGGLIAFEMAKQLQEVGKTVNFLAIVDTNVDYVEETQSGTGKLKRKLSKQLAKIPFLIKSLINYPRETIDYQYHYFKHRLGLSTPEVKPSFEDDFSPYERVIYESYDKAHQNYTIQPADVKVSLLRVKKRLYFIEDPKYLGWKRYAKQGVDIYELPGDHASILHPPNDEAFGKILQYALDKN
jgi:amino acid adenylation domain-containing protein